MNRIAADEPDEVTMAPKAIRFYFRGREHLAEVSSSNIRPDRLARESGGGYHTLRGEFGRAWIADACTMALQEGLEGARASETALAAAARQERRRARLALAEEAATARRTKVARW